MSESLESLPLTAATVLFGAGQGRYPDANAVHVKGPEGAIVIDAPLGLRARLQEGSLAPDFDSLVITHAHEDHATVLDLLPKTRIEVHHEDLVGVTSLEGLMDVFGRTGEERERLAAMVTERFFFTPRPDAVMFEDGHVWDLGGDVRVRAIHAPGHTRGHCMFHIEPDDLLFLVDVDLSGFGPYYGDAWSSLESFDETLQKLEPLECRNYLSGHHIGLLEEGDTYRSRLRAYRSKIEWRDERLLEFLRAPRTLAEIVEHRLIYRPHDDGDGIQSIERRSAELHLERQRARGAVDVDPATGAWQRT